MLIYRQIQAPLTMNNLLCVIYAIAISFFLTACGEDAPPLSCGEWTPECEMQKDYICFEYLGDTSITAGLQPVDALGLPLQPGMMYIASTTMKKPITLALEYGLANMIQSNTRRAKYALPMEYGSSGTAVPVDLLLSGYNELRPGPEGLSTSALILRHEALGVKQ